MLARYVAAAVVGIAVASSTAQTHGDLVKAYLCQSEGGPLVLVKRHELKDVRGSLCRTVEYRTSTWSVVKRCLNKDGRAIYTEQDPFDTGSGCRELDDKVR
jgi:hypothetical protein